MNHLTELELSTLADGEALSEATAAHVAECPECNEQLGLALLEGTSLQMAMQPSLIWRPGSCWGSMPIPRSLIL